jgi:hypothetical protein
MRHIFYFVSILGLLGCLSISFAQQQTCSPTTLPLQLGELANNHPIDSCACTGKPKDEPELRVATNLQNSIKNNFSRDTSNPKVISINDMIRLQQRVNAIPFAKLPRGNRDTIPNPQQRNRLTNINLGANRTFSEGDVITVAGFILGARHSNLDTGESVNCEETGCANNDIHIEVAAHRRNPAITLGKQMNTEGVVAEISPRHRPLAWDTFDSDDYTSFFRSHPVAFTGQLFYDASHHPGGEPNRAAVWEVHPVYAIWVCKNNNPQACPLNKLNDESVWLPFHKLRNFLHLSTVHVTQRCLDNP